jgi:hypothetical protein
MYESAYVDMEELVRNRTRYEFSLDGGVGLVSVLLEDDNLPDDVKQFRPYGDRLERQRLSVVADEASLLITVINLDSEIELEREREIL